MRFIVNYFEANEIFREALASLGKKRGSTRESLGNRRARAKGSHLTQSALEPLSFSFLEREKASTAVSTAVLPSTCA